MVPAGAMPMPIFYCLTVLCRVLCCVVLCCALQVCCKSLAGQSYDTSVAVLSAAAAEALSCCPGLLLLDDLDLLMPAPNTDGPAGLEQVRANLLSMCCSYVLYTMSASSKLQTWSAQVCNYRFMCQACNRTYDSVV
jgi:hypothetical protein